MLFLTTSLLSPAEPLFQTPFRVKINDDFIVVDAHHAAPIYDDIDGDGLKELLVGQFQEGRIRLYENYGTNERPVFKTFTWLEAGGEEICVGGG